MILGVKGLRIVETGSTREVASYLQKIFPHSCLSFSHFQTISNHFQTLQYPRRFNAQLLMEDFSGTIFHMQFSINPLRSWLKMYSDTTLTMLPSIRE